MGKLSMRQILVLACIIPALIVANIGGITTANIANEFDATNYFFPANFVFPVIWTTIYALVLFYAIWQALPAQRNHAGAERVGPIVAVNMILNAAWVLVFGQRMWLLSEIIIVALLVVCAIGYLTMRSNMTGTLSRSEKTVLFGFAIYFAWVTVATVANTTLLLVTILEPTLQPTAAINLFGISAGIWGVIMLAVAAVVGLGVSFILREPAYLGVFLFAYFGVVVKQMNGETIVALAAGVGAALFAIILIARYIAPLRAISIPRAG